MSSQPENNRKILFLYYELAGYTVACLTQLVSMYKAEVHLIRFPVNPVAPFNFNIPQEIKVYERNEYDTPELVDLCRKINPDVVYVCGWSDKGYLEVAKSFRKKIPVILTLDNPWLGSLKQKIASLIGPVYLKSIFTHCWVPGEPNAIFARKLGFKGQQLLMGLYSADTPLFHHYYSSYCAEKESHFPHRFIFAGRYTELKGVRELWKAFSSLSDEERGDWELWCIGKGDLEHEFPRSPYIKNYGFIQPDELSGILKSTGVFILPAYYEHWGVVVHEYAAAGFPLICSSTTSAASVFLKDGENGFVVQPKDQQSVRDTLLKIIRLKDAELVKMSKMSVKLSETITPITWSNTLWRIKSLN